MLVPLHIFRLRCVTTAKETNLGRWIRRSGTVAWPSSSSDLNPLNFIFWAHRESLVCETPVAIVENLTARIGVASADIASTLDLFQRVRLSFVRRCRL
ncbi:uncharacterized protein TNCV_4765631 [Trichonephila clavipes]|nr:uncharacterized protein TNCV_4765631 [Trichonephila clavipes]